MVLNSLGCTSFESGDFSFKDRELLNDIGRGRRRRHESRGCLDVGLVLTRYVLGRCASCPWNVTEGDVSWLVSHSRETDKLLKLGQHTVLAMYRSVVWS